MEASQTLLREFSQALAKIKNRQDLEKIRVTFLGRRGKINQLLRQLPQLPPEERKTQGQKINQLKIKIQAALAKKEQQLASQMEKNLDREKFDVTLPGHRPQLGHPHPLTLIKWRAIDILQRMGFEVFEPPEVNTDKANFTALNIPADHPARDMWDTFWTREGHIPITHTSSYQNWIYRHRRPPIRAAVISRCFRHEATDASHEHTFYQLEAVYVDRQITVANLIETMRVFFSAFFEHDLRIKVRPSYFPFVEPGLEAAIECFFCHQKGCEICKYSGWIEILGAGQIHPQVLATGGIDPQKYTGFAWGIGLDRLAMLYYGIEDIRHFHSGDLRFIRQFK